MPVLSDYLFWDVDRASIDAERHAPWLVSRVLEYGRWHDWQALIAHYGKPRVAGIVTTLRCLHPRSIAFCQAWFQLPSSAYPRLAPPEVIDGIPLLALPDVVAMKLNAIANRGAKKDFFDLCELQQHLPLPEMIAWFEQKYRSADRFTVIRSLAWFADAEAEPDPVSLTGTTWQQVKTSIRSSVAELV